MSRVIHFEIQARSPEKVIRFYERVFGWVFRKWDWPVDYWQIHTGPAEEAGINGGLIQRPEPVTGESSPGYVCTIRVESLQDALVLVEKEGGRVVEGTFSIKGIGWMARCEDPEGNLFAVIRHDPTAGPS